MTIPRHTDGTTEVIFPASGEVEKEITDFLNASPASHYRQTFKWAASASFRNIRLFVTRRSHRIVAVSFLDVLRSRIPMNARARIARGPVFSDDEALDQHLEQLVGLLGQSYVALRINPFLEESDTSVPTTWSLARESSLYSSTLIVPILATPEAQWRSLRRSTRTSINKSRSAGLAVAVQSEPSEFRSFAQHYNAFARHRGITLLDENVAANMATSFGTEALLLTACLDGRAVGGTLFMRNAGSFVYEWGWTAPAEDRKNLPVMHRLIWRAIETSRALGLSELDLGGYWQDREPTDPINHFKLGFTHQRRTYFAEHEFVLAPNRFRLAEVARALTSRSRLTP